MKAWVAIGVVVVAVIGAGTWQRYAQKAERERMEAARQVRAPAGTVRQTARTGMEWAHEKGQAGKMIGVGDQYVVGGVTCQVIEVKHATDASGVVAFEESGISLTVEKTAGVAMANVEDPRFAAFVLKADDTGARGGAPLQYSVGVYHPATGMRIAPSPPSEKPIIATLTMGWACPNITVKLNGVAQAGQFVTFVARRHVADQEGLVEHWYGADRFGVGGVDGEWETDGDGIVRQNLNDGGALQQVYFPSGEGALMQRQGDRRDEQADQPDEYLEELWCCYRGCKVRVVEGQDCEIDVVTGSIAVTGQANCRVYAQLVGVEFDPEGRVLEWDGLCDLDGAGQGTITGLRPGRYVVMQRVWTGAEVDWTYICRRRWANVMGGSAAEVAMGSMEEPGAGKNLGYVYSYGADLIEVEMYKALYALPGGPELLASGSRLEYAWTGLGVIIGGGTARLIGTGPDPGQCWECALGGSFLLLDEGAIGDEINTVWWSSNKAHRDLPSWQPLPIARETNDYVEDVAFHQMPGGVYSGMCVPHGEGEWYWDPGIEMYEYRFDDSPIYTWDIVTEDGGYLDSERLVELNVLYQEESGLWQYQDYYASAAGTVYVPPLSGGKLAGDVVEGQAVRIGSGANPLPEAARMGLEWGELPASIEVRVQAGNGCAGRVGETVCPACYGPVWRWPTLVATYTYGWCTDPGCAADARTYVRTPTVAAGAYDVRVTRERPDGTAQAGAGSRLSMRNGIRRTALTLVKWLRPVDYTIGSGYVPVTHAIMATWSNGFIDGEDTGDIRTDNACEGAVYVQPKILPNPYVRRVGEFEVDCIMADDSTRTFRVQVRPGSYPQPIVKLRKAAAAEAGGDPAKCGMIKDVTNITFVSGEGGPLCPWQVVADNPVLVDQQTPFEDAQETPWACQMLGLSRQIHSTVDGAGRIWRAMNDEGRIRVLVRDSPQRPWVERSPAFDEKDAFQRPRIMCMSDGRVYVGARRIGGKCVLRMSPDDGMRWEALGGDGVIADDLENMAMVQMANIILVAGYAEGSIWFEVSNDNGKTVTPFRNGDTRREIASGDHEVPDVVILHTGEIMVGVVRGEKVTDYLSVDAGESWTAVDQV